MKRGRIAVALSVGLGLVLTIPALALADDGFGTRQVDRHVYDNASVLAAAHIAHLESQAAASMDKAGAPTIVYLRVKAAGTATTQQDARDLMDEWQVESAPGAKDGLVLLLNLGPDDRRNGSAALVAGARHVDDGRLKADRLQAIYDGQMKPRLAAGDLAGAISHALDVAAMDLQEPADTTEANLDWQMVFIVVSIVFIVVLVMIVVRVGGSRGSKLSSSYNNSNGGDSGSTTSSGSDSAGGNF